MFPGPNALCDLLVCLIFWRSVELAIMMDLKKAYQAIHTSEMELHLRRFVFRTDPKHQWRIFGFTRATFGDLAAGLLLEVGKRRVADLGQEIDPLASQQLKDFLVCGRQHLWRRQRRCDENERRQGKRRVHWNRRQDLSQGSHEDKIHGNNWIVGQGRGRTTWGEDTGSGLSTST